LEVVDLCVEEVDRMILGLPTVVTTTSSTSTTIATTTSTLPTVGITPLKLIVVHNSATTSSKSRLAFVAKNDPLIEKGPGTDINAIAARMDIKCGPSSGSLVFDHGPSNGTVGWLLNKSTVAKWNNKGAPNPYPTGGGGKVTVFKPGKLIKIVGTGNQGTGIAGDERGPLDLFSLGCGDLAAGVNATGVVSICYEIGNGTTTRRYGSVWPAGTCKMKSIAGGVGRKLVCKGGGVGDSVCAAAA
jgi:hypothetical protein